MRGTRAIAFAGVLAAGACGTDQAPVWTLPDLGTSQGFSLRIPKFDVPSGSQAQNCYFVKVPDLNGDGSPFWVNRIEMAQNPGSHHLNVFRVRTIVGLGPDLGTKATKLGDYPATEIDGNDMDCTGNNGCSPCWDSANWGDWPLVANSQQATATNPYYDWQLPQDVAQKFTPGEMLMVQSHYVNDTDQPTPVGAKVGINFYRDTTDPSPMELGTLFGTQQNIRICQHSPVPTTFTQTCKLPGPVTITAANGHFHSRGTEFDMYSWNGVDIPTAADQFYQSLTWDDAPMATGLNVPIPAGGGVY